MSDRDATLALALDTTTRAGSLAVTRDALTVAVAVGDPARTHGERLPGEIEALLKEARVEISEIAVFGVAAGPGSFTGLRVGIAAVQGLALATGRRVVPVSTLEALAAVEDARGGSEGAVAAWMDAQRGQVFGALYDRGRPVRPAVSQPPEDVLRDWQDDPLLSGSPAFVGDGAVKYRDAILRAFPRARIVVPPPLAPIIGRLAVMRIAEAVPPHAIVPIYVRRPDAELTRDRATRPARTPSS
jgi:tRNA threonylcarbamoyladenosine biosynthesis protein TsaB